MIALSLVKSDVLLACDLDMQPYPQPPKVSLNLAALTDVLMILINELARLFVRVRLGHHLELGNSFDLGVETKRDLERSPDVYCKVHTFENLSTS